MTAKGSLSVKPDKGWQMEPIWLPLAGSRGYRLGEIATEGYKNVSLWEHLGYSLGRVIAGFCSARSSAFRSATRWACRTGSAAGSIRLSNSCARSRRWR
jgi:hypothetical protein